MEELDELLNSQLPDDSGDGLKDALKSIGNNEEDLRNTLHKQDRENQMSEDPNGLDWLKVSKKQTQEDLSREYMNMTGVSRYKDEPKVNFTKEASNNAVNQGKVLNQQTGEYEDFNVDEWDNSPFAFLGYNDFLYSKKIDGATDALSAGVGMVVKSVGLSGGSYVTDFLEKFDDDQQYDFLVPTRDSKTGKSTLMRVRSTYKDAIKDGHNILNQYGVQDASDNPISSLFKSFTNTLGQTDDVVISAAKYAQDAALLLTGNSDVNTQLDDIFEDTIRDTQYNDFLSSVESEEFGSIDWFASGTGSALASLLQFGGIGRGVRAGVSGAALLTEQFGAKALKHAVANRVATLGSSGVIGFGHAYKEALQNGLSETDALMYGTLVGTLNSAIELKLGKQFDAFLTGGGPKVISREILSEMDNKVTEKGIKEFMRTGADKVIGAASSRFSNMASEGAEEVLQDVLEQGSKLTYNALFSSNEDVKGEGKFDIRQYDFLQTVAAGIFGSVAAAPFNSTGNKMAQRIAKGEGDKVRVAIDDLLTSDKISKPQHDSLVKQFDTIKEGYDLNKNLINGLSGEYSDRLRTEAFMLINKRKGLEEAIDNITLGLKDKSPEDRDKAKINIELIRSEVNKVSSDISNYTNEGWLNDRVKKLNEEKEIAIQTANDPFGRIAASVSYDTDKSVKDTKKRIGALTADQYKSRALTRTADEASYVVSLLNSGGIDPSFTEAASKQIRAFKMYMSPKVNTMENRATLLNLGFTELELPLTSEEKIQAATNPEMFSDRIMTTGDLNTLIATAPAGMSRVERIREIFSNPQTFGLNDAKIGSLDNRAVLTEILRPEQTQALDKVLDSAFPVSVILTGGDGTSAEGVFGDKSRFVVVDGVVDKIRTTKSEKEKAKLQDHLFHVVSHEVAHGLFNRDLAKLHSDWVNRMDPTRRLDPVSAANAEYFQRMFNLARVSFAALQNNAGAKGLYFFNKIAPEFDRLDPQAKINGALSFVQEFFAETFSNEKQQQLLDSFDIFDAKNKALLDRFSYVYERPQAYRKETLLAQAIKAVSSVFKRLSNILTREDRTILTEAFGLVNTIDYNRFLQTNSELDIKRNISTLSISNYNGINIFDNEKLDRDQLLANLYKRLDKAGVRLKPGQREELLDRIKDFMDSDIFFEGAPEFLGGSLAVVYFKATEDFMLMWKTVGVDGADEIHRAFFNKFGRRKLINTDVTNGSSATTMSKPTIWQPFARGESGEEMLFKREILNNLDRAQKENFAGNAFMELDKKHTWKFDGKEIAGQVNIIYKFQDGTIGQVGYAPDLAKVRLANILSNGSAINLTLQGGSEGTRAYVKRDESGKITELYTTDNPAMNGTSLPIERVFPSINYFYASSKLTTAAELAANSVDTITPDSKTVMPKISNQDLFTGKDILLSGLVDKKIFPGFSFYSPDGINEPGTVDSRIQFVRDGMSRFVRRAMYFNPSNEVKTDDVYRIAKEYVDNAEAYILETAPKEYHSRSNVLGFETAEEYLEFANTAVEDAIREHKIVGNIANEDWNGVGGNPSGRISQGIKADIEALTYVSGNEKKWIDFSEANEIIREAAKRARTFDEIVKNLEENISKKLYGKTRMAIAESVLKHFQTAQDIDSVKNSYASQFKSFVKLDAITYSPEGESSRVFFNGERTYLKTRANEIAGMMQSKVGAIIDSLSASETAITKEAVVGALKDQINAHHVERLNLKLRQNGNIEPNAASTLLTEAGKQSNVINKILSFKSNYGTETFNLKGFSSKGIMFNFNGNGPGKGLNAYNQTAEMITSFFGYFGIEIPEVMTEIKGNERNLQLVREKHKEMIDSGMTADQAKAQSKRMIDGLELNEYYKVSFKPRGAERAEELPFVQFAAQLTDFVLKQIENHASGSEFNYAIGEMNTLAKSLMLLEGSYRSPEFYHNAEQKKEWSVKIKSYTDQLVEDLTEESSETLKKFLSTDAYKNNRWLKMMKHLNGSEAVQFMISGIKSFENNKVAKGYTSAGDLDYLYMNLSGFVHNYGSERYFHIDDVPSDKPRNMAFAMPRVQSLKTEIQNIIDAEKTRTARENERFDKAFDSTDEKNADGKFLFRVSSPTEFGKLIPDVHYGKATVVNGETLYSAGWMFDRNNFFYEGKKVDEVAKMIEAESMQSYNELRGQEMNFPVPADFLKQLNERNLAPEQRALELRAEQQRIFTGWRSSYIINRYHLNQVLMGDYMYYKQDEFADLNKRHAGTVAPSQKGVFATESLKAVIINDIKSTSGSITLPTVGESNGNFVINGELDLSPNVNRTDAQGYVTEQFASEIGIAFGSMSGYEKVFKPVVYGVNKKDIGNAQPIYMKLSLAVLPDYRDPKNESYYRAYPQQLDFAKKVYNSGAHFAVFNSGIKVGLNNVNDFGAESYKSYEFDSDLFGLQNNPYHDPNSDENTISGMVQQTKQLGDNGNFDGIMSIYHQIEGKLVNHEVQKFMDLKMESQESIRKVIKDDLARNEYSSPIAAFIDDEIRVLDVPQTSSFAEQMINAKYNKAISLFDKEGEKLVNVSDLGFQRPSQDIGLRSALLNTLSRPESAVNNELQWAGPRKPEDMLVSQLSKLVDDVENGLAKINAEGYVTDAEGKLTIYPTEVIVPEGPNYQIGDRLIATRIPTSKKSSSIPSVVVGFLSEAQGNIIATPKHGTGVLGFDFDVDGLFVWRERQGRANKALAEMFGIAYSVLTDVKNYSELTSPTVTDGIADVANEIDALRAENAGDSKIKYSKFSPERQLELKRLNSVGKVMIGVGAYSYGIHSVFEQTGGTPFISTEYTDRSYNLPNSLGDKFVRTVVNEDDSTSLVTDVYSEFINAAADNAKLQYLGRINANPTTAGVLFGMISHGASLRYATYFINQPVIRDFVKLKETRESSSFVGERVKPEQTIIESLENQIRALGGEYATYSFNKRLANGSTDPSSKAIRQYEVRKGKAKVHTSDKITLTIDQLTDGIRAMASEASGFQNDTARRFALLENQLIVLDKFIYYKSLAKITSDSGKLAMLTSGFPKTYVEMVDMMHKISESAEKISIESLMEGHGFYSVHVDNMKALSRKYAQHKLYAHPVIASIHKDLTEGTPAKYHKRLHDDFYTFLLSRESESANDENVFNLSTSSLTGEHIDPYHFVNQTAILISELKKTYPQNPFLRILEVKLSDPRQTVDKSVKPGQVMINIGFEPDGAMLRNIHQGFHDLPSDIDYIYPELIDGTTTNVETKIKSVKDIIMGHLLHTQGFSLGGFNYSKLLPSSAVKFINTAIESTAQRIASFEELNPELDTNYSMALLADANLGGFEMQARLNIPELISKLSDKEVKAASLSTSGHFLQWKKQTEGYTFDGAIARTVADDGGEVIIFQKRTNNFENLSLFKKLVKQGVVRMKDSQNVERIYSVIALEEENVASKSGKEYPVTYLKLQTVNFTSYPNLKQYGDNLYFNALSNSTIESLTYEEGSVEEEPMSMEEFGVPVRTANILLDIPVSAQNIQNGIQKSALNSVDPQANIGDQIMIPSSDGTILATVKRVWNVDKMYTRALQRDPENGTARTLAWASKVMGTPITSLEQVLGKFMIDFDYAGTVDVQGFLVHSPFESHEYHDFDQGHEETYEESVSYYKPKKSVGLYKAVMLKAGELLKSIPDVGYTSEQSQEFYDILGSFGIDSIMKQIISDLITNNALESTSSDLIASMLIEMANSDANLEHYNTAVGFDRYTNTPLEKFHEVASSVFGPQFEDVANKFAEYMDKHMGSSEYMMNEETMQPYTYYEWLMKNFEKYQKDEVLFSELRERYNDLNSFPYEELLRVWTLIRRDMDSANGLIWKNNQDWIGKLGHRVGRLAEIKSFEVISKKTEINTQFDQQDILSWEDEITSITDATERQAAVQEVGRSISVAQLKADAEQLATTAQMEKLMKDVMKYHYQAKPKSFMDKINIFQRASQVQDVFDWMLERDEKNEYTGKMVARYANTDKYWRKQAFERIRNQNGDAVYFAISNKRILKQVMEMKDNLNPYTASELKRTSEISSRYDEYENFFEKYQTMNEEEKRQSRKDTTYIRNMWTKGNVKRKDSDVFVKLKNEAKNAPNEIARKSAEAKIALYDYLNDRSNDLLQEAGHFGMAYDRGIMPQTEADINEVYRRHGFAEAKKKFLEKTQDDINTIEDEYGFVISASPIVSFENSRKVPFRTLRNKESFSINVPAIFKHHFDSLIFKKNYDEVLPLMDAVSTYYKMRFEMGGEKFNNLLGLVDKYANHKIFGKKSDFNKSWAGKAMDIAAKASTVIMLGIKPVSSLVNLTVGMTETLKNMMGDYGFKDGGQKFVKGLRRLYGVNHDHLDIGGVVGLSAVIDKKASAIINYYGIETFIKDALTDDPGFVAQFANATMTWQQNAEVMIRGAALLAEMTDVQWNAFSLTEDGSLNVDVNSAPKPLEVAEWKNRIGSIQGKYDPEAKRLFHHNALLNALFQFKGGWVIDFMRARFGNFHYDQFGTERGGYYKTTAKLLYGKQESNGEKIHNMKRLISTLKGKNELTDLEIANLKKTVYDLLMWGTLYSLRIALGGDGIDDERDSSWYVRYLAKVNSSLMLGVLPGEWIKMAKTPFAMISLAENLVKGVEGAVELDAEKASGAAYRLLPGRQIIELGQEAMSETENEIDN